MNRRIFALLLALLLALSPVRALAAGDQAFTTEDGLHYQIANDGAGDYVIITGYTGTLAELTIPSAIDGVPVTAIGEKAFVRCTGLVRVDLPDSITAIGESAFQECTALTEMNLPAGLTDMGWFVFFGCTGLKTVTIPEGIPRIAYGMFHGCSGLTEVTIPSSAAVVDSYAFSGCTGLTEVTIPEGVVCIGNHTFMDCKKLTGVILPESITFIDYNAFRECRKLESITIPAGVTEIGHFAFGECRKLTEVRFCGDAPKFGEWVFLDVNATIYYPRDNATWTEKVMRDNGGRLTWVSYDPANPFTDVPGDAFYHDPVLWAVENGITNGISATEFGPGEACNRAQAVTFLWRAVGSPEPAATENPFRDVQESDFCYKAVLWAVENGITNGTDAAHFSPNGNCNRAQVVTFLYRAMGEPETGTAECPFNDVESGAWYEAPILWALEHGITNGLGSGIFGVNDTCNRAQVVTFLYRTYVTE